MDVKEFVSVMGAEFYTGVPDSQLKPLCNYLMHQYGISGKHVIAANEGNCAALAAGYYLATGKVPVVYMQNSGLGNIINPAASLLNEKVYAIPCIFVVGWRGEPGVSDEPQHIFQGEVTTRLLEDMDIKTCIISKDSGTDDARRAMKEFSSLLAMGKSVAFVIRKGALSYDEAVEYKNDFSMNREKAIAHIIRYSGKNPVISTTGKISRELFENRVSAGQAHKCDFLTVGSMGHASSIALGVAMQKPKSRVWCIDGDGAALMHMGAMAVLGSSGCRNIVHIIINNGAHETVGGMPTVAAKTDFVEIAKACGYAHAVSVDNLEALDKALQEAKDSGELCLIEAKCAIGSRKNLGRPTTGTMENRKAFMEHLQDLP